MSIKHLLFVGVVSAIVYWAAYTAHLLGVFQETFNHAPGQSAVLRSIEHGSEAIDVLPNGLAFLPSGTWLFHDIEKFRLIPGKIYLFNFSQPSVPPKELRIVADKNYQLVAPAGVSVWTHPKTGQVYLYVISHQPTMNVDKFRFDESKLILTHVRRINDQNFIKLDDIAVTGEDQFYFTNFFRISFLVETVLGIRLGNVGYYNGTGSTILESGLAFACGVVISPDNKFVYVAANRQIQVYKKQNDNLLTYSHAIKLNTNPDNMFIDRKTGDLWFAAHPSLYKTLAYVTGYAPSSPSQVMRIKLNVERRAIKIEEIYSNDGTELTASSSVVVHGNRMLLGSVASNVLLCEIK